VAEANLREESFALAGGGSVWPRTRFSRLGDGPWTDPGPSPPDHPGGPPERVLASWRNGRAVLMGRRVWLGLTRATCLRAGGRGGKLAPGAKPTKGRDAPDRAQRHACLEQLDTEASQAQRSGCRRESSAALGLARLAVLLRWRWPRQPAGQHANCNSVASGCTTLVAAVGPGDKGPESASRSVCLTRAPAVCTVRSPAILPALLLFFPRLRWPCLGWSECG